MLHSKMLHATRIFNSANANDTTVAVFSIKIKILWCTASSILLYLLIE